MLIETAEARYGVAVDVLFRQRRLGPVMPPPALWAALHCRSGGGAYTEPAGDAPGPIVEVRVNHGRWLAACPFCGSQQHAPLEDPRFYCARCNNAAVGNKFVPVRWPPNTGELERTLAFRPDPKFQNWEPGESVADLRRQDLAAIHRGQMREAIGG